MIGFPIASRSRSAWVAENATSRPACAKRPSSMATMTGRSKTWLLGAILITGLVMDVLLPTSHENDVELLLVIGALDLERDGLADEIREHREALRLLVEEHVDHLLGGEDAELARVELPRFAQELAQDLVAHRLRRLELPAPLAHGARLAQHVSQRFPRALARHLDETQLREAVHRHARAVAGERLAELLEHGVLVLVAVHVDEVDDDDPAEVAHPKLARDHLRGLEIGLEDRIVEAAPADVAAGVHVDRGQRLGLVDDEITPGLQIHAARERLLDLVLDAVEVEERSLALVMLEPRHHVGRELGGEFAHCLVRF